MVQVHFKCAVEEEKSTENVEIIACLPTKSLLQRLVGCFLRK